MVFWLFSVVMCGLDRIWVLLWFLRKFSSVWKLLCDSVRLKVLLLVEGSGMRLG